MSGEDAWCYVARCRCGCGRLVFAAVDIPARAADNANAIADLIREGLTIERATVAEVRAAAFGCAHQIAQAALPLD